MNAFVPCHSSTPKSASKSSVMRVPGDVLPAHPRLDTLDVRLRRARDERERGVAGVQVGEVGDLVGHHGAADAAHARASRPRRARRRRGTRSADGGRRTGRAGSPCRRAPRTRSPSPRPATASAGARRPARHGRGSAPSPSRAVRWRAASHSCGETIGGVFTGSSQWSIPGTPRPTVGDEDTGASRTERFDGHPRGGERGRPMRFDASWCRVLVMACERSGGTAVPTDRRRARRAPGRATRTPSASSSSRTAASCRSTATGSSARSRTPRTCCRRRCSRPGAGSIGSRGAPRCGSGSTASRPTAA